MQNTQHQVTIRVWTRDLLVWPNAHEWLLSYVFHIFYIINYLCLFVFSSLLSQFKMLILCTLLINALLDSADSNSLLYFTLDKYTMLFFFFFTMLIHNVNCLIYTINNEGIFLTILIYIFTLQWRSHTSWLELSCTSTWNFSWANAVKAWNVFPLCGANKMALP